MIDVAKQAGADAVKFQTFTASEFCGDPDQLFTYKSQGKVITESMLKMFQRYELTKENWAELKRYCDSADILFFSTPQNESDLNLLLEIGVPMVKVGSDDFSNLPLLEAYKGSGLPLILSCGMADLAEVHDALKAAGWFDGHPVSLLLCTSQYPAPIEDVNLTKITTLKNAFPGLIVGFSDHTQGCLAASVAIGLGAKIFEKHFTLDKEMVGPDHWFSENPEGLTNWIKAIHASHIALGSPYVFPTKKELVNKKEFRRVLVASREISQGEVFTEKNLAMRRVTGGVGLPPKMYWDLLGKKSWKKFGALSPIEI